MTLSPMAGGRDGGLAVHREEDEEEEEDDSALLRELGDDLFLDALSDGDFSDDEVRIDG